MVQGCCKNDDDDDDDDNDDNDDNDNDAQGDDECVCTHLQLRAVAPEVLGLDGGLWCSVV